MEKAFFQARLVDYDVINLVIFTSLPKKSDNFFVFFIQDHENKGALHPTKQISMNDIYYFEFKLKKPFEFGRNNELYIPNFGYTPIDTSSAPYFRDFDKKFAYNGDDLGATYSKSSTTFKLWAPLASQVSLLLHYENEDVYKVMSRGEKGVYQITIEGDLEGVKYKYLVTNSGVAREARDIYGKEMSLNSQYSVVIDLEKYQKRIKRSNLNKTIQESSIYELHVRDFTIDNSTDIVNKGKYLGLIEENRKTKKGHPAGFDYLKFMGFSHVQLLPLLDYGSVDDVNFKKTYNWGYDPISFFSIEGSYASRPDVPGNRIEELQDIVNKFHKNNIGVILDVVYNHIYQYETSDFEKIVPNYFFRRKNGYVCNGSGCGDDFATERVMARKIIVDSMKYLTSMFDFDGYRFDLMGMIDIKTMETIRKELSQIKDNIFIYGEGWSMNSGIDKEDETTIMNSYKTPYFGYFNDSYRDILKGNTFDVAARGYINGDHSYVDGMYFALMGSSVDYVFPPRFVNAAQSINFVECHDNMTIYDKLVVSNPEDDVNTLLARIRFANALLAFSFGVPFYHMGQEIGLSKEGEDNTYNMGDKYNKMSYDLLDERFAMSCYLKDALKARKKLDIFSLINPKQIEKAFDYKKGERGSFTLTNNIKIDGFKKVIICVNPDLNSQNIALDDYYEIYFGNAGIVNNKSIHVKNIMQPPLNVDVLVKKEK